MKLAATEFRVLEYLAANAGIVLSRDQILDFVWGNVVLTARGMWSSVRQRDPAQTARGRRRRTARNGVGDRLQIDRVVLRVAIAYTAVVAVVLLALGAAAFAFLARVDADALRPIIDLPEGADVYHKALLQAGLTIGAAEVVLLIIVACAAYALAHISTRPLFEARERERRFASERHTSWRTPLARISTTAQAARGGTEGQQEYALGAIAKMAIEPRR